MADSAPSDLSQTPLSGPRIQHQQLILTPEDAFARIPPQYCCNPDWEVLFFLC